MSYTVAVRTLCEFTARSGDLDLRFSPSPSAQQGMAGHALVQSRRGAGYRSEVALSCIHGDLLVRGRADGYDQNANRLEEIKTHRGAATLIPENQRQLHKAQLKIYGWLLCREAGLQKIELALVYFDIVSSTETVLCESHDAASLKEFFEAQCECFMAWARSEIAHRAQRDTALGALSFPHPSFRPGQRHLAETIYKSASTGRCVIAQAPTGIGKTIATVFPLLKAMPVKAIDKLFFLAAKTSGRQLALDALALLRGSAAESGAMPSSPAPPLRVVELVARDKACEYPGRACDSGSCPLARGFYDRLPAARAAAVARGWLDRAGMREVALTFQVCPYYLSQDLVRWADVVIGDYNYYFDLNAMLFGLTVQNQWRVGVLVDEAHNMVERARKMYSSTLKQSDFYAVRSHAPASLSRVFDRLDQCWRAFNTGSIDGALRPAPAYEVLAALPGPFIEAVQQAGTAILDLMTADPLSIDPALLRFYFDGLNFTRVAELRALRPSATRVSLDELMESSGYPADENRPTKVDGVVNGIGDQQTASAGPLHANGLTTAGIMQTGAGSPDHSLFDITRDPDHGAILCLRNVVTAPYLAPRFKAAHSVALFSGTLSPAHFYQDVLGLPEDTVSVTVESPFHADQLAVRIACGISTRFQHRQASVGPIAQLMGAQYAERPGNYLAFFSSFDYLQRVANDFRARYPHIPTWLQERAMDEAARTGFLESFREDGQGIGFAVLGGAFGEGIDLPGDRLIGAFIATLGLPQWNEVNEEVRQKMEALYGAGHDYTYLYPGLQKVVQAAGRVIRTQNDCGVVHLIDDRYAQEKILRLLPEWWNITLGRPGREDILVPVSIRHHSRLNNQSNSL